MSLQDYLLNYCKSNRISFHMPGHKGLGIFKMYGYDNLMKNLPQIDITEIMGADNLHKPEGIIKKLQDDYAKIYGAKKTFLLVNGSTTGILAAIMASIPKGKKILVARNCHKSVYGGTVLADCTPIYVMPKQNKEFGIVDRIDPADIEKILKKDFELKNEIYGVILPSPNYYGICSDIKKIADVTHKYDKVLIVDQAHGAHLKVFENIAKANSEEKHKDNYANYPMSAESSGADLVINSTHKTMASFTQSAILNVMSDRVDIDEISEKLKLIQSTSPSYILMLSLDINKDIIKKYGEEAVKSWWKDLEKFYKEAHEIDELEIFQGENLDRTKINLSLGKMKIDGASFEEMLFERGIDVEFATGNILMAMTGIGNVWEDYEKLLNAIKDIIKTTYEKEKKTYKEKTEKENLQYNAELLECESKEFYKSCNENEEFKIPSPGRYIGIGNKTQEMRLQDAAGFICKDVIAPYPPGIPFACPGEVLTKECVNQLLRLRKENKNILGISKEGKIRITEFENK